VGGNAPHRVDLVPDFRRQPGWVQRLHPVYGPWMGLRAACFTTEGLTPTGPLGAPSPCEGCAAPCAAACPGRAMRGPAMDWRWCTLHRASTADCLDQCHSRAACPEGAPHRYPPAATAWHHDKARGRRAVVEARGLVDAAAPEGTDWADLARRAAARLRPPG
jgi:hypothetical protein